MPRKSQPVRRAMRLVGLSLFAAILCWLPPPAALSASNGKIAFASTRDGNYEIYAANPDGSGAARLTNNAAEDFDPAWSPDGTKIAFVSTRDGNHEIYLMNADGSGQTRLTNNAADELDPAWSPDGRRIAFTATRDGDEEVYAMNADGSGQTNLSRNSADDNFPAWSPDGAKLAFTSDRDGDFEIYSMNADGGGQTKLSNNADDDAFPAWAPGGARIAFSSDRDGNYEVYLMNADGSGQTRLTNNSREDTSPAWAPDGTKITFMAGDLVGGQIINNDVHVMNADGGGRVNITNNPADDVYPDWQPLTAGPAPTPTPSPGPTPSPTPAPTPTPAPSPNPIDGTQFFVTQHYRDFLSRDPDAGGLQFWSERIEACGADAQCRRVNRVNVSAAFYLSIEFQETGYLVYRFHKAAFGDLPGKPVPVRRDVFLTDTRRIGQGVQVGVGDWRQRLEANKAAYAQEFAAGQRFLDALPAALTAAQFVDRLNQNAGGALSQSERDALVADLTNGTKTRAQALRAVAEDADLGRAEFNKAFVLMQYFGYMQRDPDSGRDTDFSGFNFWLAQLNRFGGNFQQAEMVRAFIESIEYRERFGRP